MMSESKKSVIVSGAASQIGYYLIPRLLNAGYAVRALTRKSPPAWSPNGVTWQNVDLATKSGWDELSPAQTLIHIAPLWMLPDVIEKFAEKGVRRVIAFGSTSMFTKKNSTSPKEREIVAGLEKAETEIARICKTLGVKWTVFRPTLIYGAGMDRNVTTIAKFIKRFGVAMITGEGKGLRQPVHADDLAAACVDIIENTGAFNKAYNLTGGSTITYRQMTREIFQGMGRRPRIITVPLPFARFVLRLMSRIPRHGYITPDMANRMNEDLKFDSSDAVRDFGYSPRPFKYEPKVE